MCVKKMTESFLETRVSALEIIKLEIWRVLKEHRAGTPTCLGMNFTAEHREAVQSIREK